MKNLVLLLSLIYLAGCSTTKKQSTPVEESAAKVVSVPTLELLWETDTLLTTAECVIYDKERDQIYVANVNENPWEKDSNGFISKLDTDGNILELKWIDNLNGPKGMGIRGKYLFVNDIDQIREIDIERGTLVGGTTISGDPTLNDISLDKNILYASGSNSHKIFSLKDQEVRIVLEGDLGRPNGLLLQGDKLLMLTNHTHRLVSINLMTKEQTILVDSLGHADGIVPFKDGEYIVSNWKGQIFHISKDYTRTIILDTIEEEINAADIDYIPEKQLLLVPTFFDNRLRAYKVVY
ncbi:MAG: gluconolaconase [Cyclobacteriaceae bacterium]